MSIRISDNSIQILNWHERLMGCFAILLLTIPITFIWLAFTQFSEAPLLFWIFVLSISIISIPILIRQFLKSLIIEVIVDRPTRRVKVSKHALFNAEIKNYTFESLTHFELIETDHDGYFYEGFIIIDGERLALTQGNRKQGVLEEIFRIQKFLVDSGVSLQIKETISP